MHGNLIELLHLNSKVIRLRCLYCFFIGTNSLIEYSLLKGTIKIKNLEAVSAAERHDMGKLITGFFHL